LLDTVEILVLIQEKEVKYSYFLPWMVFRPHRVLKRNGLREEGDNLGDITVCLGCGEVNN